jgi:acyl-CoA thioester hydrolase
VAGAPGAHGMREIAAYPIRSALEARVSDLDGYGHLNGIRIGLFYEDARARSYGPLCRATRLVVAQFTMRYLAEGTWPGTLAIGSGVSRIGRTSFVLSQGLFQQGACIGLAETVLVRSDGAGALPLGDDLVEELRAIAIP